MLSDQEKIAIAKKHPELIRHKISDPGGWLFVWENTNQVPKEKHGKWITNAEWQSFLTKQI